MVDNPDKLCTICIRKFESLLKFDQLAWKKQIEEHINKFYDEEKNRMTLH